MRPIHGAAPGISAADHWTAMRDNPALAMPANPSEAVATGNIHTLMPPSRAHIKRLLRPRPAVTPAVPRPPREPQRNERLDFHKRVIAALGGSPTIVGDHEEHRVCPREPGVSTTLEQHRAERVQRERHNLAVEDAKAARKRLAWRALATGQGELML